MKRKKYEFTVEFNKNEEESEQILAEVVEYILNLKEFYPEERG